MIAALEIGTLVENPSALSTPRPPLMKRVCAGVVGRPCDLVLGWVVCAPGQAGEITHGACEACRERAAEELADYLANTLDVGAGGEPATRAATPHATRGAVNDNASEAPGHAGVLSLSPMNTTSAQPFTGMTVQAVAEATGLSRGEIYRVAGIMDLGAPAHFRYVDSNQVYTPDGLAELVTGMDECGHTAAAGALRALLAQHRSAAAAVAPVVVAEIAPAPAEPIPRRDWIAEHEARQEDAA